MHALPKRQGPRRGTPAGGSQTRPHEGRMWQKRKAPASLSFARDGFRRTRRKPRLPRSLGCARDKFRPRRYERQARGARLQGKAAATKAEAGTACRAPAEKPLHAAPLPASVLRTPKKRGSVPPERRSGDRRSQANPAAGFGDDKAIRGRRKSRRPAFRRASEGESPTPMRGMAIGLVPRPQCSGGESEVKRHALFPGR